MRLTFALAAALLLAGCFTSETALYPESAGQCPFTTRTTFTVNLVDAGGAQGQTEAFTITPVGRSCERTAPQMQGATPPERALFIPFENGWHILQREPSEQQRGYIYQLARIEGDRISFYMPQCPDFTPAALAELGVTPTAMPTGETSVPEEAPRRTKSNHPKQADAPAASDGAGVLCTATSREQIERAFRAWIALGRLPAEYGVRSN